MAVASSMNPLIDPTAPTTGPNTASLTPDKSAAILHDLPHFGLIVASGEDAEEFLQGQLTSDLSQLGENTSQLSAYCSPQGRMLALLRLFRRGQDFCLLLPRERLDAVLKRLRMFVLRANATLEDAGGTLDGFGLSGMAAAAVLEQVVGAAAVLSEANAVARCGEFSVLRVGSEPRWMLFGPAAQVLSLRQQLLMQGADTIAAGGSEDWRLLDIHAGIPAVYDATADQFVPQMVNLHTLGGVNFQKGCYVGQEVVARTQYLGRLKRHMIRLSAAAGAAPLPGDKLVTADDNGRVVGQVVDAVALRQGFEALAVVLIGATEQPIKLIQTEDVLRFEELRENLNQEE